MAERYNARSIEKKWQTRWENQACFRANDDSDKPHVYVLEMFPYPSGTLHVGHARNYVLGDVYARYRRALGYEVLYPMGWDAFGLPAENAAFKHKVHPKEWTYKNARTLKRQMQLLGCSHDWSREIFTCDPEYYGHQQKMFLEFYKRGIAYRKESCVNWDPVENSVLANEQVIEGRGWRSGALIEKRLLKQWFFRVTDFAESLLTDVETLTQWPDAVRQMQINWIGRSAGMTLTFALADESGTLSVFTTRPETIYGMTFCAIAPDHPLATQWAIQNSDLSAFVTACKRGGTSAQEIETAEKKGVYTGHDIIHPLIPDKRIPIYVANYVLSDYGIGAVFGCPGHDQRDYEFAQKYGLPIIFVIRPTMEELKKDRAYGEKSGVLINSGPFDGLTLADGSIPVKLTEELERRGIGQANITYRIRDWGVSRQRYWGTPIPVIHCPKCGVVPVPEEALPVTLPEDVTFDQPGNPLDHHPTWKHVACPKCGGNAERETDTLDTFVDSSWYFARFCDPHNPQKAFSAERTQKWMPVAQYIGGIEHAVLHLLYARFFSRALKMCGYWDVKEPFEGLFTQGMVCHKTYKSADGEWICPHDVVWEEDIPTYHGKPVTIGRSEKMSKSKCNVIGIDEMAETYGVDALRFFLLSDTPPERDIEWTDDGIEGCWRYINRIWALFHKHAIIPHEAFRYMPDGFSKNALALRRTVHKTIHDVNKSLDDYHLNKYVSALRTCSNAMENFVPETADEEWTWREALEVFTRLLAPIAPHLAEELWSALGHEGFVHRAPWPSVDSTLIVDDLIEVAVQIDGKMRGVITIPRDLSDQEALMARVRSENGLRKYLENREIKRVIVVPGRAVSIVTCVS